ncbi:MAG: DsbA family protein [Anaerolineae bacterium]|nr:DsbA family protein [Anaerolineae bacterium]
MTKLVTGKIVFVLALLVIGGAALAFGLMTPAEKITGANVEAGTPDPAPKTGTAQSISEKTQPTFLNYDMVIGDKNAPVEIIEYAAISCSHCAHFHQEVMPDLKKTYLDTGKAKLIYRNFIFDNPFDVYASLLTRCVTEEKFFSTVQTYFDYQKVWLKVPEMREIFEAEGREAAIGFAQSEVAKIGKMAGMTDATVAQCFDNDAVIEYLLNIRKTAVEKYDVNSTPTLIVGGKKIEGHDMPAIAQAIKEAGN